MFNLIYELTNCFGVSGTEELIRDLIRSKISGYVDEIAVDTLGNLIATKKGTKKQIMVAAHMDEIGIIATFIDEKGFIRFSNIGGVSAFYCIGQRVQFKNGVIGTVFFEEEIEDMKNLKLSSMYIDIGGKIKKTLKKR